MTRFPTPRLLVALPAAAALLLAAVVPARAAAPHLPAPGDWLRLSLTAGDSPAGGARATLLLCDPPQGGHPHAAEACADLAAADGDIRAVPPQDGICALVYAPVTAQAAGRWNGRPVAYTETFANACVMRARTGAVFALDDVRGPERPEPPVRTVPPGR
ncbi:SSI family serine proteinase inhibitor [Streptomyces sp. NPDC017936]|uniref:SSI family serine proteinase inhibitor n=1 Tax=Streptomyces sp. NPDC017936 TaxID=3365016 RepID=UPI0037B2220F